MDVFYAIHIFLFFLLTYGILLRAGMPTNMSGGGINWRISLGGKKIWRHM